MSTFAYKGFSHSGRPCRGLVEAWDRKEAREKLARQGILTERLSPAGEGAGRSWLRRRQVFSVETRAMLYRELSALVHAGLPLEQSLDVLIGSPELGVNRSVVAAVRDRIREGAGFAHAIREASPRVSPLEEAVLEVGERTGALDAALDRLAGYLDEQQAMTERIATALLYPSLVLILALGIGLAVLGVMVPRVGRILEESALDLPGLTVAMLAASRFVGKALAPAVLILALAGTVVARRVRGHPGAKEAWDRFRLRIPLAGQAYTALINLRFSRTLALLLRAGVPLTEGMTMAGRATGSAWTASRVAEQADLVRQGRSLADALRHIAALRGSLPGWIEAGEASGDLSGMLESAAVRYQQQWDRTVSRFLALLEPALVLIVGLFVLLVALSILLPLLSMNQILQ